MQRPIIRKAKPGDEEAIAHVHIKTWQQAYRGLLPAEYLENLPQEFESRKTMWTNVLRNDERWTWVGEGSEGIVGFAMFGPPRDQNREGYVELNALYLLEKFKNQGIGYELLSAGFFEMRKLDYQKAYCWVLKDNPTIRFYERTGGRFLGQTKQGSINGQYWTDLAYEWDSLSLPQRK